MVLIPGTFADRCTWSHACRLRLRTAAIVREMDRHPMDRVTIRRYIECDRRLDLNPVMRNVDAATLVMLGSQDALTGIEQARAVSASVPRARLEVIDDAGHSPHLETPMAFARIVTSFLNG